MTLGVRGKQPEIALRKRQRNIESGGPISKDSLEKLSVLTPGGLFMASPRHAKRRTDPSGSPRERSAHGSVPRPSAPVAPPVYSLHELYPHTRTFFRAR